MPRVATPPGLTAITTQDELTPVRFAHWATQGRFEIPAHIAWLEREYLVDFVYGDLDRLIIEWPPRHGKSQLMSLWTPAWLMMNRPTQNMILASYEAEFAAKWGRGVRNLISEWGHLYGVRLADDSAAKSRWATSDGGEFVAAGIGGPITGRGADYLIIDDPVKNAEQANSSTYRERDWDWYNSTAYTRLQGPAKVCVIQTRWHEDDLAGRLQRESGDKWTVVKLPAIALDSDPMGRSEGEALWPGRFSVERLRAIQAQIGPYWWNALYQQSPQPPEGGDFKRKDFRYYTEEDVGTKSFARLYRPDGEKLVALDDCVHVVGVDLAASTKTSADYTVIAVKAYTPDEEEIVREIDRRRMEAPDILPALQQAWAKYRPSMMFVESAGLGLPIVQEAIRAGLPVTPAEARGDKIARAQPFAARLGTGQVYFRRGASWLPDLEDELLTFPTGAHDDQVDALAHATIGYMQRGGGKVTLGPVLNP